MKHLITCAVLLTTVFFSKAQTRVSLLEEFTGESCLPCAAANPALDALLAQPANASKIIAIKWQVPIPAIPFAGFSLYQTNMAEIDWRYKGSAVGGYGYLAQYTPSNSINDGILNAPTCFIDGKNQWTFGATSDHPYYLNNNIISTAAAVPTPFSISMSPAWNSNFTNCVVTVTITSSSAFTALGNLVFRLCLVERYIKFQNAPGANGEKEFYDAVRQSYPTTGSGSMITAMGTALPGSWTAGQTQVLTISCAVPSYIQDKSQMAFVGFVQDDGDRQVYQTARTGQPSIPNDAKAENIIMPLTVCTPTYVPSVSIKNNGPNAITALTITPYFDYTPGTDITWSGNLASMATTTIPMDQLSMSAGSHTYAITITGVSGGDVVTGNNSSERAVLNVTAYSTAPFMEGFEAFVFPPANWLLPAKGSLMTFQDVNAVGAYNNSYRSVGYPLFYVPAGKTDEIYLPPVDLIGTANSQLSFDLAYQQLLATSKDSLNVFVSSDCGVTWVKAYSNGGSTMATAALPNGTSFNPAATEWTTHVVPLANYATSPQVMIRFQVKADGGNGLFIDNINLKAGTPAPPNTTGINTYSQQNLVFNLYPNPASSNVMIVINNSKNEGPAKLELLNVTGQVNFEKTVDLSAGDTRVNVDCKDMPGGVYFVKMTYENRSITKKLVISK